VSWVVVKCDDIEMRFNPKVTAVQRALVVTVGKFSLFFCCPVESMLFSGSLSTVFKQGWF